MRRPGARAGRAPEGGGTRPVARGGGSVGGRRLRASGRPAAVRRRSGGDGLRGDRIVRAGLLAERPGLVLEGVGRGLRLVVLLLPPGQHLDVVRHDLGLPVALALVVVPAAGLDPALDRDLLALPEVLAADLGELVPGDDRVELGLLLAATGVLVRGDVERRDALAAGQARSSGSRVRRPVNRTLFIGPGLLLGRPAAPVPTLRLRRVRSPTAGGRRRVRRTLAVGRSPPASRRLHAACTPARPPVATPEPPIPLEPGT